MGTLLSAGAGVWLEWWGALLDLGDADARSVEVGAAFAVDVAFAGDVAGALPVDAGEEAVPVDAREEAVPVCVAVVAGEVPALPVCVLVDAADGE